MEVQFDLCEMAIIEAVAKWRMERVKREGLRAGHGEGTLSLYKDTIGAAAEMAVSKVLDRYWGGRQHDFGKEGDVLEFEVRGTEHANGHLIVFPGDPDDRFVVLVHVALPRAKVLGWAAAGDAKSPEFTPRPSALRDGSPTQWWLPQRSLRPGLPGLKSQPLAQVIPRPVLASDKRELADYF